jgi:hypothetical protein
VYKLKLGLYNLKDTTLNYMMFSEMSKIQYILISLTRKIITNCLCLYIYIYIYIERERERERDVRVPT